MRNKPVFFSCICGMAICVFVTAFMMIFYTGKYPQEKLSFADLLQCAEFQNYSLEESGLLTTSIDPIIIIPLSSDHNDVKAIRIDIAEMSGFNDYWAEIFLYDDTEWVVRDFWVKNGTTNYILNRTTRTDDFAFLRVDLCDVEQVFISLEGITINPFAALLESSLAIGVLCGICVCILFLFLLLRRGRSKASQAPLSEPDLGVSEEQSKEKSIPRRGIRLSALGWAEYLLCAVLSLGFTASPHYIREGTCRPDISFFLSALVLFAAFVVLAAAVRTRLEQYRPDKLRKTALLDRLLFQKLGIIKAGLLIFICWLPLLLMLYPGTVINDTWGELTQYADFIYDNGYLTDHHPFFDTLLLGTLILPIARATGKWHAVLFAYTVLQSFATCLAFAYAVSYARKKLGLGIRTVQVMFLSYCLLPLFPLSAQTIGKDSFSAWLLVVYVVQYMEVIRTKGRALKNVRFFSAFLLWGILFILSKKINTYIVLGSLALLVVFERKAIKQTAASLLCMILFVFLLLPSIKTVLNTYPGGKQEMFSLPFQMTARYVRDYPADITEDEYAVIDRVLTMDDLAERYDPLFADPVKGYQQKGTDADYLRYIRVWAAQGLRHPDAYIHAANAMLSGWFSWEKYLPLMDMDHHTQLDPELIPEWVPYRDHSFAAAETMKRFYNGLYSVPLFTVFLTYGLYASIFPAFIAATVFRRWRKNGIRYWLGAMPTLFSLALGCWLAPANIQLEGMRYLYPIIYTTPLLLMWCLYAYKEQKNSEDQLISE